MDIIDIQESQVQRSVDILVKAFAADPMFLYVFNTPENYLEIAPKLFTAWVRWAMKYGVASITVDENAVLLLRKVESPDISMAEMMQTGLLLSPTQMGSGAFNRFYVEMISDLAIKHSEIMGDGPHWYGWVVATDSTQSQKGLASSLIKHGSDIATRDHLPVFLETSIASNVPFYIKRGFELRDELHTKDNIPFYFMVKPYIA